MEKIINKWNETKGYEKTLYVLQVIGVIALIFFGFMWLTGSWTKAAYVFEPLIGVNLLIQSIIQRDKNEKVAKQAFFVAMFIFIASVVLLFL